MSVSYTHLDVYKRQMYVNCELPYYYEYTPDMDYESLASQMSTYLHFSLNGPYENQEAFAADAAAILADIRPLDLNTHNITFNYSDNDVSYSLDVNGRFQPEQSAAALAQMVEVRDYSNEDYAEAVSYTHLDVYKRQQYELKRAAAQESSRAFLLEKLRG